MSLERIRDTYYRSGRGILRVPETCWKENTPIEEVVTANYCTVDGVDDGFGNLIPDFYTGLLYLFPEDNGNDSEAYLFMVSHDPDDNLTSDDLFENSYDCTKRIIVRDSKLVSLRINGPDNQDTFKVLNKSDLSGSELFVIDEMFKKYNCRRV